MIYRYLPWDSLLLKKWPYYMSHSPAKWYFIGFCILRKPFYYLFYSGDGNDIQHYHVGVARSYKIKGTYEKSEREILHIDNGRYDNGENSTFVGPGKYQIIRLV